MAIPLIADVSLYQVEIDANFNGTTLYIFGARNGTGEIIAVLRGESANYVVRKKERVAGFWVNTDRYRLTNVPVFYALALNKNETHPELEHVMSTLKLGLLDVLPPLPTRKKLGQDAFVEAFLRNMKRDAFYSEQFSQVRFMGDTLFKAAITLPDNVPPGHYVAEVYLVNDGEVVGMQATPVEIRKVGLDAKLAELSRNYPAVYGLLAVVLALSIGWLAGRIFEKI